MTKAELVRLYAERNELSQTRSLELLNDYHGMIREVVAKRESIIIPNFGTYAAVQTAARVGRNPRTGKKLNIPAKWRPKFHAGKEFSEMVLSGGKPARKAATASKKTTAAASKKTTTRGSATAAKKGTPVATKATGKKKGK